MMYCALTHNYPRLWWQVFYSL